MNTDKFEMIYSKYYGMLYRICFLYMKNTPDALDIVQDVFLKVLGGKAADVSDEKLKAWLIVTASNLCKSRLRSWWFKNRNEYDESYKNRFENTAVPEQSEIMEEVLSLEWKYRVPVYLYYYEGYTTSEIGRMLKASPSTIQTRLAKARTLLRLSLENEWKGDGSGKEGHGREKGINESNRHNEKKNKERKDYYGQTTIKPGI